MKPIRLFIILFISTLFISPIFYSCKKKETPSAKTEKTKKIHTKGLLGEIKIPQIGPQKISRAKGYIYKPRGRRDPFMPLIVPKKEKVGKGGVVIQGTLQSYDIGDFTLVAIAKKEDEYYALLVAPDNRSFTVREGVIIGLHKGRVEKILDDKVIIIEHSKDYRGRMRTRQITLELHKGEVK